MNRLRSYRWIEQKTQKELAELLGVSAASVSAMESGRRPANCDIGILGYREMRVPSMTEPLHRHRASTPVASMRRAKELLRLGGEAFSMMKGEHSRPWLERIGPVYGDEEIVEAAREVRIGALAQEENAPLPNLTTAAERAGICLIPIVDAQGIDGMSSWVGRWPVIGLNPDVPGDRLRLSLAHEIGHLVMHKKKSTDSEREAFRFASVLLMDDDDFEAAMPQRRPLLRDFVGLKSVWGISVSALIYRAHQSDFLDDRSYRSLQIQMSKWRKREPGAFSPAYGVALPRLVKHYGGVSSAARSLGINVDHLQKAVAWPSARASHLRMVRSS